MMNLMDGAGLDGKSVLVGAGLVMGGFVAAHSGAVLPLALIGGFVYLIGQKKRWWGDRQAAAARGPFAGPPAIFDDWHRQSHADRPATWQQQDIARSATPQPPAPPRDAEIRIPVTETPGYTRTVGDQAGPVA
ncbi:MAG: hypothetical protein ACR2J8_12185 [Thermomicrobiales bacterium]